MVVPIVQSKEYIEFLKENLKVKKLSFYERVCRFSEKTMPIPPWKGLRDKYKEAIDFSHLKITPQGAFSTAILAALVVFIVPLILIIILGYLSLSLSALIIVFSALSFYYAYDYPMHYSVIFRIRASEEMVLSIVYMSIAMRVTPNLENAIKFASENLSGPLATDLRQLMWDVYMRKYDSMSEALDGFIVKWKMENEEFTEALYLIKTSIAETTAKRETTMTEAVDVVLNGSKERMKHYAQELNTPVTVINAIGIVLPIIGLVFFPIIGIFLAEMFQPAFITLGYNILLPFGVYWMMKSSLERRPYSFHQPDIRQHLGNAERKFFDKALLYSLLIFTPPAIYGGYYFLTTKEVFSFNLLASSLIVFSGLTGAVSFYLIYTTYRRLQIRKRVVQIENEFTEALFQLGKQLERGIPIETALDKLSANIKDLEISKMFGIILSNIRVFGMTFEQAVFDKNYGAIKYYPSKTINAIMKAVVEISKRGMSVMSSAMISISEYLKGVHTVEEDLKDMLSEVTSTMHIQALLLAPLTSGIVVALSAMIMRMLLSFKEIMETMHTDLLGGGPAGFAGGSILTSIINLDKMMPVHIFQMVVGIYLIEVIAMLAMFLSKIQHGEETLMRNYNTGKMIVLGSAVYILIVILLYTTFEGIMPVMEPI